MKMSTMDEEYLQDLMIRFSWYNTALNEKLSREDVESIILKEYIPRPMPLYDFLDVEHHKNIMFYIISRCEEDITAQDIITINRMILLEDKEQSLSEKDLIRLENWCRSLSDDLKRAGNDKEKVFCIMEKHLELNDMHIFPDRNKCTGRALIIWSCLQHDLTPIVIEKEQRYEYIRALEEKSTEKLYRIAEKSQQIEREKREELVKNLEKDHFPKEKEGEKQEIDKNMLKTLYNELEYIHNTFPQNEELEAEKAEIQSSITVIKSKDEYERVKEDIRQYERDCMIHRRNLKKIREREAREQGFERYIKRY